jgi:hypothetical protein
MNRFRQDRSNGMKCYCSLNRLSQEKFTDRAAAQYKVTAGFRNTRMVSEFVYRYILFFHFLNKVFLIHDQLRNTWNATQTANIYPNTG